ncbi:ATP-binding protein [Rhodococcus pyridinivorans]|uniref:ATP-binding protein n=1 Tax=Rhodococcus pyridinivorans TaxID=103816 RepID=UPI0009E73CF2|nr:ATP-binding protein [Rhodococcus pyridinivorans]MCD2141092.1 ATP-binding protein [Rhodococcus pyridinivorans]
MKYTRCVTRWGQEFDLDGLTVLVGPNNSGKSQTLRDIHSFITNDPQELVVLSSIKYDLPESIPAHLDRLNPVPSSTNVGYHTYSSLSSSLREIHSVEYPRDGLSYFEKEEGRNDLRRYFGRFEVALLDAGSRLAVAQSSESHDLNTDRPQNLLQSLFLRKDIQERLDQAFFDTFGMHIRLDFTSLKRLYFRVSENFGVIPDDIQDANQMMRGFPNLDDQGDGFRSFVGVVLSVLLACDRLILLDEPEAFLHPEQARRLGRWIAQESFRSSIQIVVSTHNSHFLQGLLSGRHP